MQILATQTKTATSSRLSTQPNGDLASDGEKFKVANIKAVEVKTGVRISPQKIAELAKGNKALLICATQHCSEDEKYYRVHGALYTSDSDTSAKIFSTFTQDDRMIINFQRHMIISKGKTIKMSMPELLILKKLKSNKGYLVSRSELMSEIAGICKSDGKRAIDSHIKRIRNKFRLNGLPDELIVSDYGNGYYLDLIVLEPQFSK